MTRLDVHVVTTQNERNKTYRIRRRVFIDELHVTETDEFDGYDDESIHVIASFRNKSIGCARIRITNDGTKLERVAILPGHRQKGFGTKLMEFLLAYCRQQGLSQLYLHAQIDARGFYEKFGFEPYGERFMEAGLEHIAMKL